MPELSERLKAAASLVRQGSSAADIGTDHAYLPVYLIKNHICKSVIACDLRSGPLFNALETIKAEGLENLISLRLSDGLCELKENEAEDIIICGMGGTLIARILSQADWICNKKYNFIFQPQSHADDLRRFLFGNGFSVTEEITLTDDGRDYLIFSSVFTGDRSLEDDEVSIQFGSLLYRNDEVSARIVNRTLKYLEVRAEAEMNYGNPEKSDKLRETIRKAEAIINGSKNQ